MTIRSFTSLRTETFIKTCGGHRDVLGWIIDYIAAPDPTEETIFERSAETVQSISLSAELFIARCQVLAILQYLPNII